VVEQLTHNPMVKGSNPDAAGREKISEKNNRMLSVLSNLFSQCGLVAPALLGCHPLMGQSCKKITLVN
jgi:hypothetical protein